MKKYIFQATLAVSIALVGYFFGNAMQNKKEAAPIIVQAAAVEKPEDRSQYQHSMIVNNWQAKTTISAMQARGWHIMEVKPMSEPSGVYGLYDILIVYEIRANPNYRTS